jgi:hypothetical protein
MLRWLAGAVVLGVLGASSAQAQMKGLGAIAIADTAKNRTLDYKITDSPLPANRLPLPSGMLVGREVGPGATIGVGLANVYQRRRGWNLRPTDPAVRSRKPAVTFVMKF